MQVLNGEKISSDISFLVDGISSLKSEIPSIGKTLKASLLVPVCTFLGSLFSSICYYYSDKYRHTTYNGLLDYFLSDGWIFVAPTLIVGFVFFAMSYNNLLLYLSIPKSVRDDSLILLHLKRIVLKVIYFFLFLIGSLALCSSFFHLALYLIPALEFALIFVVNMIVGMEINRLGVGSVLNKMAGIIKKI